MKMSKELAKENVKRIYNFCEKKLQEIEKDGGKINPNTLKKELSILTLKNINTKILVDVGEVNSIVPFGGSAHRQLLDIFENMYISAKGQGLVRTYDISYIILNNYIMKNTAGFKIQDLVESEYLIPTKTEYVGGKLYRFYVENKSYKLGIYPIAENQMGEKIYFIVNSYNNKKYAMTRLRIDHIRVTVDLKELFHDVEGIRGDVPESIMNNHFYNDRNYLYLIKTYVSTAMKDFKTIKEG